jgi:hypothetical protein
LLRVSCLSDGEAKNVREALGVASAGTVADLLDAHGRLGTEGGGEGADERGSGWGDEFLLDVCGVRGEIAEEVSGCGCGGREAAVSAINHASANIERGGVPGVNGEGMNARTGGDDVDDGVDGADFVEMDLLDVNVMNLRLAGAEKLERADGGAFYGIGQECFLDEGANARKGAAVGVRVIMLVGVLCVVVVMVRVSVLLLVFVVVLSMGMVVGVLGGVAAFQHIDLGRRDSAAIGLLDGERSIEFECGDGLMENFGGDAAIDQGSKKHVAADAGEAVEIGDAHGQYCFMAKS